tara:strand:+ start:290 stop:838 length:549 start_codon:yes stop_codon:yes gene_type:complete
MQRFTLEKVYFGEAEPEIRRILINKPTDVIRKTCDYLHIKEHMLVSERRDRIYIDARSMLTALFRYHSKSELPYMKIGKMLNRNHATAINSLKRHANMTTLTKRGKPMNPQYLYTYNTLRDDLCYVYDPSAKKKIIYGKELRLAIQPGEVASNDWKLVMNMEFDIVQLKNLIDQHPLLNEHA